MPQLPRSAGPQGEVAPVVPLLQRIATRDGTLDKDSKMVNCFAEVSPVGNSTVKRPGTIAVRATAAGTSQGQFLVNSIPFAIQNDVIYNTNTGTTTAIPGVATTGQQYSTLSDAPLGTSLLKSPSGLWKFDGTTVTKITDVNYPALTVTGIMELDGSYYVMDSTGAIRGSALQDPMTWPALNFISADVTLGVGVGIHRHLNYVVAFYSTGTQFYYDAGNSPGIALGPVGNASWTTGCANGRSIANMSDVTYFVGRTHKQGKTVQQFSGLSIVAISNPFVEKILNLSTMATVHSFTTKTAGHSFYGLTLVDLGITLVYDDVTTEWALWSSVVNGVEQYFTGINYLGTGTQDLFQDSSTGTVVAMTPMAYTDTTGPINIFVRTPCYDFGTLKWKRYAAMFLLADTVSSTLSVRFSDDDYQTYSAYRTVDMSSVRKMLQRCGRSRRRSWDFLHTANTPLKLYSMQLDLTVGPS
jgi:hypothetical protein